MTDTPLYTLGLIGCGHMGSAMLHGWLAQDIASHIHILDPTPKNFKNDTVTAYENLYDFSPNINDMDCIVLAVKPQIIAGLSEQISSLVPHDLPVLSIAAGFTLDNFHRHFHEEQPIIRCMPNTPGAIGKGITGALRTKLLTGEIQRMVDNLLCALGEVVWVDDETLMDSITAVSGSGPAYIFYMIEALTRSAQETGLPKDVAEKLARQTVIGAAALAESKPDTDAATLRQNVTSPGGTTEAALKKLMDGTFQDTLTAAVKAAAARGKELSK